MTIPSIRHQFYESIIKFDLSNPLTWKEPLSQFYSSDEEIRDFQQHPEFFFDICKEIKVPISAEACSSFEQIVERINAIWRDLSIYEGKSQEITELKRTKSLKNAREGLIYLSLFRDFYGINHLNEIKRLVPEEHRTLQFSTHVLKILVLFRKISEKLTDCKEETKTPLDQFDEIYLEFHERLEQIPGEKISEVISFIIPHIDVENMALHLKLFQYLGAVLHLPENQINLGNLQHMLWIFRCRNSRFSLLFSDHFWSKNQFLKTMALISPMMDRMRNRCHYSFTFDRVIQIIHPIPDEIKEEVCQIATPWITEELSFAGFSVFLTLIAHYVDQQYKKLIREGLGPIYRVINHFEDPEVLLPHLKELRRKVPIEFILDPEEFDQYIFSLILHDDPNQVSNIMPEPFKRFQDSKFNTLL